MWAQHTMLDLNALADHISLWKQAVKTLMDKEMYVISHARIRLLTVYYSEEWTGRAEAANVWVTNASGHHPVSSGFSVSISAPEIVGHHRLTSLAAFLHVQHQGIRL